jgi:hypothetical protein
LKRATKGTCVRSAVSFVPHLNEQSFRFDNRKDNDGWHFVQVAKSIVGKRLTYKALIGEELSQPCLAEAGRATASARAKAKMKTPQDAPRSQTPMERLVSFTKKLISGPKAEISAKERQYEKRKRDRQRKRCRDHG